MNSKSNLKLLHIFNQIGSATLNLQEHNKIYENKNDQKSISNNFVKLELESELEINHHLNPNDSNNAKNNDDKDDDSILLYNLLPSFIVKDVLDSK